MKIPNYINEIISDQHNYPKIIVKHALEIKDFIVRYNSSIQQLWDNRTYIRNKNKIKQQVFKELKIKGKVKFVTLSAHTNNRFIADYGKEIYSILCNLSSTKNMIRDDLIRRIPALEAAYRLVHTTDMTMVLKYIECMNSRTKDSSLSDVAYFRKIPDNIRIEIFAWRLVKKTYN